MIDSNGEAGNDFNRLPTSVLQNYITFRFFVGNGICDEYHVIRHVMNLEAVNTYEGGLLDLKS